MLRTARDWKVPPSTLLATGLEAWCEEDRLLSVALTEAEADLCPGGCGQFLSDSRNNDVYEVRTVVCHACAAREEHVHEARDDRPTPGQLMYVTEA